jgi:hypothetical protein
VRLKWNIFPPPLVENDKQEDKKVLQGYSARNVSHEFLEFVKEQVQYCLNTYVSMYIYYNTVYLTPIPYSYRIVTKIRKTNAKTCIY